MAKTFLKSRHWAIIDIEGIQTRDHICTRKCCVLDKSGWYFLEEDFNPCIKWRELDQKLKKQYKWCYKHIHGLQYTSENSENNCETAITLLKYFIEDMKIDLLLYKGGHLEQDLAAKLGIKAFNLEDIGCPKVRSHDPKVEVYQHFQWLLQHGYVCDMPFEHTEDNVC